MTFFVEQRTGATIVAVFGEVDLACQALFERLSELTNSPQSGRIIVDLTDCSYIDSSGLSALIKTHKCVPGGLVVVVSAREAVNRIFRMCGLDTFLRFVGTAAEALPSAAI